MANALVEQGWRSILSILHSRRSGAGLPLQALALIAVTALVLPLPSIAGIGALTATYAEKPADGTGATSQRPVFLWGAATSSYQVEGNITNNDFNFFNSSPQIKERVGGGTNNMQPAGEADREWDPQYYLKDFDNAKSLGLNSYRLSLEWSRIEPLKGVWDQSAIEHYRQMIMALKARGITPVVTLEHFTLPLWVLTPIVNKDCLSDPLESNHSCKGEGYFKSLRGWDSTETVDEYVKYVSYVVPKLKDLVDYWLTLNEPVGVYVSLGYIVGLWSPGFVGDGARAKVALHNLLEAHVRAYDAISSLDDVAADKSGPAKMVGFANAMMDLEPVHDKQETDAQNAKAAQDASYYTNDYFINAVVNGEEDQNFLNTIVEHNSSSPNFIKHPDWKNKLDFVGVNYYRRAYISYDRGIANSSAKFLGGAFSDSLTANGQPASMKNDLGWEIYPNGLYRTLMHIKNEWNKPIMITENGIADGSDKHRAQYIVSHIEEMMSAIKDGANVIGYMHWSLVDNWELQEDYRLQSHFGLFHVNRAGAAGSHKDTVQSSCGVCSRELTTGARAYQSIVLQAGYSFDEAKWENSISAAKSEFGYFTSDGTRLVQPAPVPHTPEVHPVSANFTY